MMGVHAHGFGALGIRCLVVCFVLCLVGPVFGQAWLFGRDGERAGLHELSERLTQSQREVDRLNKKLAMESSDRDRLLRVNAELERENRDVKKTARRAQDEVNELMEEQEECYMKAKEPRSIWLTLLGGLAPPRQEKPVILTSCTTIGCCLSTAVQLMMSDLWDFVQDPLLSMRSWLDTAQDKFISQLPLIQFIAGGICLLLIANTLAFFYLRAASIFSLCWAVWRFITGRSLSLVIAKMVRSLMSGLWAILHSDAGGNGVQIAPQEAQVQQVQTSEGSTSATTIPVVPDFPGSKPEKRCDYCGRKFHTIDSCWMKKVDDVCKSARNMLRTVPEGETLKPTLIVNPHGVPTAFKLRNLVYTPAVIAGIKFSRCLVDTGSEANILPMKDVTKNGMPYRKVNGQAVRGFDGQTSPIAGILRCSVIFGPSKVPQEVEFLISNNVSIPIIGFPALHLFGLSVNCKDRELVEVTTGNIISCSAVENHSAKN